MDSPAGAEPGDVQQPVDARIQGRYLDAPTAIPFDLETIVLTLIAKDPAKRYPAMCAVAWPMPKPISSTVFE